MKRFLIILPYFIITTLGLLTFKISNNITNDSLKEFLIGISVTFISIPLLYLTYDWTKKQIDKKLKKELSEYAKMQIDKGVLSIINRIIKIIYPYDYTNFSPQEINKILSINQEEIKKLINANKYFGFQIFKKWDIDEKEFHDTLKNTFILKYLENEQIISIISLIKSLRLLEDIYKQKQLFLEIIDDENTNYKVVPGNNFSCAGSDYVERHLLLYNIGKNKYIVKDFGDFYKDDIEKLLKKFKISEKLIGSISVSINELLKTINKWLQLTGNEFLIDTKVFRVSHKRLFKDINKY
jgi:hypothetical protein